MSPSNQLVNIRFKGTPGQESDTRYFSTSRILTYSDQQLVKDRTESVDFTVHNKVNARDAKNDAIQFSSTTVRKDGIVPLHDLAFPEKDEVIDYIVQGTGRVLKAGRFPPHSIFYIPSVPVPESKVEVGDTWAMEHVWNSARDGIPLKLEVAAILKGIVPCEKDKQCADIEISGHVNLVMPPDNPGSKFESRLWGRMLFGLERGDVVWAHTRNREEMVHDGDRVSVSSCMVSELKASAEYKTKLECEPKEEAVTDVPKL